MNKKFNLKQRAGSFRFAFKGLMLLLKHEPNARIHVTLTIIVIVIGILVKINATEWSLISLAAGLVLMAEAMNSSVERMVDTISPEKNEQAGRIKDLAAAGVLLAALASATVGLIIFIPKLISLI